jgi:hypothetical protein
LSSSRTRGKARRASRIRYFIGPSFRCELKERSLRAGGGVAAEILVIGVEEVATFELEAKA